MRFVILHPTNGLVVVVLEDGQHPALGANEDHLQTLAARHLQQVGADQGVFGRHACMTVQEIVAGGVRYAVSGTGYAPRGEFFPQLPAAEKGRDGRVFDTTAVEVAKRPDLAQALTIGTWCNNARLVPKGDGGEDWQIVGDPTEGALIVAARKGGIEPPRRARSLVYEIPFDSSRKAMSVAVREANGQIVLYTQGAPEVVLEKCIAERRDGHPRPLTEERRQAILAANAEMASRALRVLGLAYRPNPPAANDDRESQLVFAGLVGMIDPPREEAKVAVERCRQAGIRPVMITGDHPATALAVARQLGLVAAADQAVSGPELERITDDELTDRVEHIADKLRIVKAWKWRGQVVAMTGDGVNDAPAVKAADIGIAMGITGTDVTKEASDMVLTDDNFASIVSAVEEGRGIFDNIQKVLQFLLSCNAGEILLMLVASLIGWPAPLLPIQLLWINLVTDGLPALALSLEPPEPDVMRRKPRRPNESILSARLGLAILFQGLLVGAVSLVAFGWTYSHTGGNVEQARATAFCVLVYAELLRAIAARSQTYTLGQLGFFSNPYLLLAITVSGMLQVSVAIVPFTQRVFDVPFHTVGQWLGIVLLALTPVTLIELLKLARQRLVGERFVQVPPATAARA